MTNTLLQIKIKERLNKLASFDYDNIECWQITEAFNKAQLEWVRRQIHGHNQGKEGDESTKMNIDDVQLLITDNSLTLTEADVYYESNTLPEDYLYFKRMSVKSVAPCCSAPRPMIVYLAQVGDVDALLADDFRKPSSDWGETFCTFSSNKIKLYTNGQFELTDAKLFYYRRPLDIQITGCMNPSTGIITTTNVDCEFKDDIVELLIDETCAILAGDIESMTQIQRSKQNATLNN